VEKRGTTDRSVRYDALGYRCASTPSGAAVPLVRGGPYCRTAFFIDARSGRLGMFYTAESRFVESHGVKVGMTTSEAERLLKRQLHVGCEPNIYLRSARASLTIGFSGGVVRHDGTLNGGHVSVLVLHGRLHDPGLFECI